MQRKLKLKWVSCLLACWLALLGGRVQAQTTFYGPQNFDALTTGTLPAGITAIAGSPVVGTFRPASGTKNLALSSGAVALFSGTAHNSLGTLFKTSVNSGSGYYTEPNFRVTDATGQNGYELDLQWYVNNGFRNYILYPLTGGTVGTAITTLAMPANLFGGGVRNFQDADQTGNCFEVVLSGTSATFKLRTWDAINGSDPGTFQNTYTDNASPLSAGGYIAFNSSYAGSVPGGITASLDDVSVYYYATSSASFTASPSSVAAGSVTSVTLTGSATAWTSGTTFSATNANITGVTVTGQSATLTLTSTGAAGSNIVITDSLGDGASASITVTPGDPVPTHYADNTGIEYLGLHVRSGTGATSQAVAVNEGSGIRITPAGCTSLKLCFKVRTTTNYPAIGVLVDGTIYRYTLDSTGLVTVTLPSGQTVHRVRTAWMPYEGPSNHNLWGAQTDAVTFIGLQMNAGATLLAQTPNPSTLYLGGDSRTATYNCLDSSGTQTGYDILHSWGVTLGSALGLDVIFNAHSGTGIVSNSGSAQYTNGGFPTAPNTLGYVYSGATYTLAYEPTVAILSYGTNDNAAGVSSTAFQSGYLAYVSSFRALYPHTIVFLVNMPGCSYLSALNNIAASTAAGGKVYVIDASGTTFTYTDTVHFDLSGQMTFYSVVANAVQSRLTTLGVKVQGASVSVFKPSRQLPRNSRN